MSLVSLYYLLLTILTPGRCVRVAILNMLKSHENQCMRIEDKGVTTYNVLLQYFTSLSWSPKKG